MYVLGTHQAQVERESRGYVQVFQIIPNVAPAGVVEFILTSQEQPSHPGPTVQAALPNVAPADVVRYFTTTQESPFHPGSSTWNFIQVLRPPGIAFVETTQELPSQPNSGVWNFIPVTAAPVVLGPVTLFFEASQEYPDVPVSSLVRAITPAAPISVAPGVRFFATEQEAPFHPGPLFLEGTLNLVAPGLRYFTTVQEWPWHPGPATWNFIPPIPNAFPITFFSTLQESPDVPSAAWARSSILNLVPPGVRFFQASQEQPSHPGSLALPALVVLPVTPVPPGIHYFTTLQEWPYHPGSYGLPWPGPFGNGPPVPPSVFEWLIRARRRIRR